VELAYRDVPGSLQVWTSSRVASVRSVGVDPLVPGVAVLSTARIRISGVKNVKSCGIPSPRFLGQACYLSAPT